MTIKLKSICHVWYNPCQLYFFFISPEKTNAEEVNALSNRLCEYWWWDFMDEVGVWFLGVWSNKPGLVLCVCLWVWCDKGGSGSPHPQLPHATPEDWWTIASAPTARLRHCRHSTVWAWRVYTDDMVLMTVQIQSDISSNRAPFWKKIDFHWLAFELPWFSHFKVHRSKPRFGTALDKHSIKWKSMTFLLIRKKEWLPMLYARVPHGLGAIPWCLPHRTRTNLQMSLNTTPFTWYVRILSISHRLHLSPMGEEMKKNISQ